MISLIGNKWEGYTLTREYDATNNYDVKNAFEEARKRMHLTGVNHGVDIPTTTFERIAKQHGML